MKKLLIIILLLIGCQAKHIRTEELKITTEATPILTQINDNQYRLEKDITLTTPPPTSDNEFFIGGWNMSLEKGTIITIGESK